LPASQRATLLLVAVAVAATRVLAIARSPWDWDELLFCHALRDYDVARHHPHPPGFPLFIGAAKLVRLFIDSDFRALQTITVVASLLVFPAVYCFARVIGVQFATAVSAGVLCALFPTVWFFGGTAFTDVPSMVLVTFAAALLWRSESRSRLWLGVVLLALSIGVRPQNVLMGVMPVLAAFRTRDHEQPAHHPKRPTPKAQRLGMAGALLVGAVIVAIIYGAAMHATGADAFRSAFRAQSDYVLHNDSFLNPERPSLFNLLERFFLKPYGPTHISIVLSLFVVIALFARGRPALLAMATFGPFALFAWLMLDRFQVTRYAIAYAPMLAILAAIGIATVAGRYAPFLAGAVALVLMIWTMPALTQVRTELSPAVAAIEQLRRTRPPSLFVGHSMTAFVDYYLPGAKYERVIDFRGVPVRWTGQPWLLADTTHLLQHHDRLWSILRRQYFAATLAPVRDLPRFTEGWTAERVMHTESTLLLPPRTGAQLLRLDLHTPPDANATLTITLNGKTLDTIPLNRDYRIPPPPPPPAPAPPTTLHLTVTPPSPIRLEAISWGPV
jgi:hypothetical protein